MFLDNKIAGIKPSHKVLDIGPGANPHPRADVYLEKKFNTLNEAIAQSGFATPTKIDKDKIVYYSGGKFPFGNKEFDYVICSHVIEHIPKKDLMLFISEIERVGKRGYIEFPNVFYELINFQPVHKWFMYLRKDTMLFLDKKSFKTNLIHQIYKNIFYKDTDAIKIFKRNKDVFFNGLVWKNKIKYRIVKSFDELINESDAKKIGEYLQLNKQIKKKDSSAKKIFHTILNIYKNLINVVKESNISASAILEDKNLINLGENCEIQNYVIVRTKKNKVVIGDNTQINPFTVIYGGSGVVIGNNVMIGPHVMIAAGNHDYKQTILPMIQAGNLSKGPISIEDDVWIGANSTITDGVRIGKGSVIGANSVVTKNIPPYAVAVGVPAKVIKFRKKTK